MTGSPLIPIVAPMVMLICLGIWIAIVFYADSHPGWKRWRTQAGSGPADASAPDITGSAAEDTETAAPPARRAA
jgi:hypothetical protein